MADEIVNRVANSSLITFDLADYYPKGERVVFDLEQLLFQGLLLREKDFREFVKQHNWEQYKGQFVAVYCSTDAIVPAWAYMVLATKLEPFAEKIVFGDEVQLETALFQQALDEIDFSEFQDRLVVVKGCGEIPIPESAYLEIAIRLRPYVKKLMYGEACSAVPVYRKPKPSDKSN